MKCKNCGAELNNGKCEYCGSVFLEDMLYFVPNIKINEEKLQAILRKASNLYAVHCCGDNRVGVADYIGNIEEERG